LHEKNAENTEGYVYLDCHYTHPDLPVPDLTPAAYLMQACPHLLTICDRGIEGAWDDSWDLPRGSQDTALPSMGHSRV